MIHPREVLPPDAAAIMARLHDGHRRVLVCGATGTGKSTLTAGLAGAWRGPVLGIGADPGSPAFGLPGAVALAVRRDGIWRCVELVPLCTLDAARFRLPLVQAAGRLSRRAQDHRLIVDAPGVARGVAAAELIHGLAAACSIDVVIVLGADGMDSLAGDLGALGCRLIHVTPAPQARPPARDERVRRRTALWDDHLSGAIRRELPLSRFHVTGTPPPRSVPEAWRGRQVALLQGSESALMGEVVALAEDSITLDLPAEPHGRDTLMIRDAQRNAAGSLVTAPSPAGRSWGSRTRASSRPDSRDPVSLSVGGVALRLVNGVLGDPLLELRVANVARGLLFDLGDAAGMSARDLHAVSDVFVSHAHIDHIGGFLHLLRARLSGGVGPCRLFGPPGLRDHVAGFVAGVRWDRIGDAGPQFRVAEVDRAGMRWSRIQPGREPEDLGRESMDNGILLRRDDLRVRCATLDHGIPVLAFLLQRSDGLQVREDRLERQALEPGPWLGALKHHLGRGDPQALVALPGGERRTAGELGDALVRVVPGTRIAYATDLADTTANRRTLAELANGADLFVCEATFLAADALQAQATGHLTVRACVEIALQARVRSLLPFHFSRRYSVRLDDVRDELLNACRGTALEGALVGPPPGVRR